MLTCLLPAAGASSRMRGGDKLLEAVGAKPCLVVMTERALAAGFEVIVTLPDPDHPRSKALGALPITRVFVKDAATRGMSASLVLGLRAMRASSNGVMIVPPDMPDVTSTDMVRMRDRFGQTSPLIARARAASGTPGHPIVFCASLRLEFEHLKGDIGAQSIVKKYKNKIEYVDFEDERPLLDLDTPEDWDAWRRSL